MCQKKKRFHENIAGGCQPPLQNSERVSGFAVGADDLGGPRAHTVRPYGVCSAGANPGDWATARVAPTAKTGAFSKDGGRGKPLPYERNARFLPPRCGPRFKNPPSSVTASPCHLPPWRGKACGRLIAAPTVHRKAVGAHSMRPPEFAPVPLVRQTQARLWNRSR